MNEVEARQQMDFSLPSILAMMTNIFRSYHNLFCPSFPLLQTHQPHHCPFSFYDYYGCWSVDSSVVTDPFLELCVSDGTQGVSAQTRKTVQKITCVTNKRPFWALHQTIREEHQWCVILPLALIILSFYLPTKSIQ